MPVSIPSYIPLRTRIRIRIRIAAFAIYEIVDHLTIIALGEGNRLDQTPICGADVHLIEALLLWLDWLQRLQVAIGQTGDHGQILGQRMYMLLQLKAVYHVLPLSLRLRLRLRLMRRQVRRRLRHDLNTNKTKIQIQIFTKYYKTKAKKIEHQNSEKEKIQIEFR